MDFQIPKIVHEDADAHRGVFAIEPLDRAARFGLAVEVDKAVQDELKLWGQALKLYRARDWDMAELQLLNLQKANAASALYKLFLGRIALFRRNPPEQGWDGSWKFETK